LSKWSRALHVCTVTYIHIEFIYILLTNFSIPNADLIETMSTPCECNERRKDSIRKCIG